MEIQNHVNDLLGPTMSDSVLESSEARKIENKDVPTGEMETRPIAVTKENLENVLDTSIDSGIHDVVTSTKPMMGKCGRTDVDFTSEEIGELHEAMPEREVGYKEGPFDVGLPTCIGKTNKDESCSVSEMVSTAEQYKDKIFVFDNGSVKDTSNSKQESSLSLNVSKTDDETFTDTNSEENECKTDSANEEVSKTIENDCKEVKDTEVIVEVTENSILMDYRSSEKVISKDYTSDSSPDSSDSENEDEKAKDSVARDTVGQINIIASEERDVSPEREKKVKLNRHGFEDIRTKGELLPEDLPPLEELTITVDDSVYMLEVGSIKSIVGILVVIQSKENISPLDEDTILFVEGHKVLGQVFETFGPVKTPWYSVRFNQVDNIKAKGLKEGMPVYCAPKEESFTKFVFVDGLQRTKGSDASWEDNNEPPEKHLDYSDDESERRAKAKQRGKKVGDLETGGDDGETTVQKKNRKNRNRNKANKDDQNQPQYQSQPQHQPKRGWNPFQGNQSQDAGKQQPRFGSRNTSSNSGGQKWPPANNNYQRPARFGSLPNFQQRPRFGLSSDQQQMQNQFSSSKNRFGNNTHQAAFQQTSCTSASHSFNMHSSPPSFQTGSVPGLQSVVQTSHVNFGANHCNTGGLGNIDFSRPPPPLIAGQQFGQTNQQITQSTWNSPGFGQNQQGMAVGSMSGFANNQQTGFNSHPCSQMMNIQHSQSQNLSMGNQIIGQQSLQNQPAMQGNNTSNQTPYPVQSRTGIPTCMSTFPNVNSQMGTGSCFNVLSSLSGNNSSNFMKEVGSNFGQQSLQNGSQNFHNGTMGSIGSNKKTFQIHSLNPMPGEAPGPSNLAGNRSYESIPINNFAQCSYNPQQQSGQSQGQTGPSMQSGMGMSQSNPNSFTRAESMQASHFPQQMQNFNHCIAQPFQGGFGQPPQRMHQPGFVNGPNRPSAQSIEDYRHIQSENGI